MSSLFQLLVAVGLAVAGGIIALLIDKKEHSDARQARIDFSRHDDVGERRGAAMSSLR